MDSSQTQHNSSPTEALWALILQKDKVGQPPKSRDLPQVPTGPMDRNATSTRILLYDTQARLEQFSSRADSMLKGIQDANQQLKQVGMLFEKDRDTLTNDMIDLVNRSQTEIQKALGQPAQESRLLALQEKVELRIEGLNQRLDALHMFNQTHCQALETHSRTLKSIQDQQNALLSAILPLLPLAQGITPQLELLKACIQEVNSTVCSIIATLKQDVLGSLASHSGSRKRRLSAQPTEHSPAASKKIRIEPSISSSLVSIEVGSKQVQVQAVEPPTFIPVESILASTFEDSNPTPREMIRKHSILTTPHPKAQSHRNSSTASSRTNSVRSSPLFLKHPPSSRTPSVQHRPPPKPPTPLRGNGNHRRVASTISQDRNKTPHFEKNPVSVEKIVHHLASTPVAPPHHRADVRGPLPPPHLRPDNTPLNRSPLVDAHPPSSVLRTPVPLPLQGTSLQTQLIRLPAVPLSRAPFAAGLHKPALTTMGSFIPGNKLRGRRFPPRDRRRFIPLDDDDDDDDDEGEVP